MRYPLPFIKRPFIFYLLFIYIFLFISVVFAASNSQIKEEPWSIRARELVFYHNSRVVVAKGDVEVIKGKLRCFAQKIIYDSQKKRIYASGNVVIHMGEDVLKGKRGRLDLITSTGEVEGGILYLKRNNIHLTAKKMEKIGPEEYYAEEATVSTCPFPDQDWRFRCKKLKLTVNGEAEAKHSFFEVKNIPIFYTPWLFVPINRYRKTGFLIPEYTSSKRNGIGVNIPFFLALNDSMDFTFYQHPMSSRGWMQGIEYRHVFSNTDKMILRYNFLYDTKDDNDFNGDGHTRGNKFRWWLRGKVNQSLPFGFNAKLDMDLMSDMDYLQEFDSGLMGFSRSDEEFRKVFNRNLAEETDNIRPTIAQITKETTDSFLGLHGRYNDNHFFGERGFTVQTLPSVFWHVYKKRLWKLVYYSFDFDYTDYYREQGTKEHRLKFTPGLSIPLDLFNWGDLVLEAKADDTVYVAYGEEVNEKKYNNTANKFRYILKADLSKTFSRNFNSTTSTWRHYITPRVRYEYSPHRNTDNIPSIDIYDNYDERNKVVFSLLSFVSRKWQRTNGAYSYRDVFRIKVEEAYNFHKEPTFLSAKFSEPKSLSDLYAEMDFSPFQNFWLRYDSTYNFYGDGFRTHNVWWRYTGYLGSTVDLYYRYHKLVDINELNFDLNAILTRSWSFKFHIKQDFKNNKQIESRYALRYTSSCWALEGKLKTDSDDTSFLINLELLGIGGWSGE